MNQDIIEMARQAGLIAPSAILKEERTHDRAINAFAKLVEVHVLLRTNPKDFMSYQEGFKAGNKLAVDGFCKQLRQLHDAYSCASDPSILKARGEA